MEKLISIVGTNASGKSSLGIKLAGYYGGEIVSADSRQVYKYLDLGTGKVTEEEMMGVKHHLLDVLDLNEKFSVADFQRLAYEAIDGIISRGKLPFLVGGTGLYTRAVVEGYDFVETPPDDKLREELNSETDEQLKARLESLGDTGIPEEYTRRRLIRRIERITSGEQNDNANRPKYDVLQLGLTWEREELRRRIAERLDRRFDEGMIDEVKNIMSLGATPEFLMGLGLEYKYIYLYLTGAFSSYSEFRDELFTKICQFAKRQMTWFRKEKNMIWLDSHGDYFAEAKERIDEFIKK